MRPHHGVGVTQRTAWFMLHVLRKAWNDDQMGKKLDAPVEIEETYVGGKAENIHNAQRKHISGRGGSDQTPVVGIEGRASKRISAKPVSKVNRFVVDGMLSKAVKLGAEVCSGESGVYGRIPDHESVNHRAGKYVRGEAHTNGTESCWSLFRRGFYRTYHKMKPDAPAPLG